MAAANWSELDKYLLEDIGENFHLYSHYLSFRSVCSSWRSSLPHKTIPRFPCLLLPPHPETQTHNCRRGFHSIFLGEVYQLELPETATTADKVFIGSSHGWIASIENGPSMYLFNPLTKAQLQLPPLTTFPEVLEYKPDRVGKEYLVRTPDRNGFEDLYLSLANIKAFFVQKVVLSSSPSNSTSKNYCAMSIYGWNYLAFCKQPQDSRWTKVDEVTAYVSDIILYKDNFYAVDYHARIHKVVDMDSGSPRLVHIADAPEGSPYMSKTYLVESSGDLLMVGRYIDETEDSYGTTDFYVYKLNLNSNSTGGIWSAMLETLGDRVLFVGNNDSMSFSYTIVPGGQCKGDCIYFTDDYLEGQIQGTRGGADLGVFDYKNKTLQELPGYKPHSQLLWPPPIWVFPNP